MIPIHVRHATVDDIEALKRLYRLLEEEMTALSAMWSLADGLAEPVTESLRRALVDPETVVALGEIDGVPVGFLLARVEELLPQAKGERLGAIRLVFVEPEARGVGVGEAMRDMVLDELRGRGIRRFDAHVLPGHRMAKNFFEAGGFAARSIVMHHEDQP